MDSPETVWGRAVSYLLSSGKVAVDSPPQPKKNIYLLLLTFGQWLIAMMLTNLVFTINEIIKPPVVTGQIKSLIVHVSM